VKPKPSGVETLKTLRAAVELPTFTLVSLAEYAGVSKLTVSTVRERYKQMFKREVPSEKVEGKPGRPPERWSLRPESIDEVADLAQSIRTSLTAPERAEAPGVNAEVRDALLVSAADALASTADANPKDVQYLLETVRNSVSTVRAAQEGDIATMAQTDFLESVAQVVSATFSKDQTGLEVAQARALADAVVTFPNIPAQRWLSLVKIALRAPSSVMLGSVIVDEKQRPQTLALFPNLIVEPLRGLLSKGYVRLIDKRLRKPAVQSTGVYLEFIDEGIPTDEHDNVVFVGKQRESFAPVMDQGGSFVLEVDTARTRREIANAVNSYALGLK
jgi:hypothetical protein